MLETNEEKITNIVDSLMKNIINDYQKKGWIKLGDNGEILAFFAICMECTNRFWKKEKLTENCEACIAKKDSKMNENKLKAYIMAEIWRNEKIDNRIVFHFSKEEAQKQFITKFDDYDEKEIKTERDSSYDKYVKGDTPYFLDPHKTENEYIFYENKWHNGDEDAVCQGCERDTYKSIPKSRIVCQNCHYCLECATDHELDGEEWNCDCEHFTKENNEFEMITELPLYIKEINDISFEIGDFDSLQKIVIDNDFIDQVVSMLLKYKEIKKLT